MSEQRECGDQVVQEEADQNTTTEPEQGGHTPGEPEQGGHTSGEPEQGGHTSGEPEQGGHTPGEPEQGGHTSGEPEQGGHTPGEPEQGGHTSGAPEQGGHTPGEPPEEDSEPQSHGDEEQAGSPAPPDEDRSTADVLQTVEEAGTDADLSDDPDPQKEEDVGNSTATVKVVLVPEGHVMTVAFAIGLSMQELKCHLASELRMPVEVLQLSLDGKVVEGQQSLMELGVRPHSSTQMEMNSMDPESHPLRPLPPPEHDSMPDVITVQVQTGERAFQEVVVEIERPRQRKAFLGGYRHRQTGVEYHNAAVQTLPRPRPDRGVVVLSHNTQTVRLKSQAQQKPLDVYTQMTGIGYYASCMNDKLVTPGKYITADEIHDRKLRAAILLQSYARRWLAQQAVDRIRRARDRRLAWQEMQERRRIEEKEELLRDRCNRLVNPQSRVDYILLFHALEKWRTEEEAQINASLRGAERRAALCSLLEEETNFIAMIGHYRITTNKENYEKFIKNLLDKSAAPLQWRAADGRLVEMDSLNTIRARELRDVYEIISQFTVSKEQRLHNLLTLKDTVKEHRCPLTRDILNLIDREVDLMGRGLKPPSLEGLRRRICTLFLLFIKTPAFNPEMAKLLKVSPDSSQMKTSVHLCGCCNRYLHSADFRVSAGGALSNRCRYCIALDNIARSRIDFSCYENILKRLRADEQQINKESRIPFLLKVEDLQYLIDVIWGSRSAFQASSNLYNLVFVRWDRRKDWSPWNCILLCKEETSAHLQVEDVHKVYEVKFISEVQYRHAQARCHFSQTPIMAEYLAATVGN